MAAARSFRQDRKSGLWTPNRKPPLQSRVNWQHPIVRNRSLIACYLGNEGGGKNWFDIAGNSTGTFVNSPAWVAGQNGPAIDLAATSKYIEILDSVAGGHAFTGLDDNITISALINPSEVTGVSGSAWFSGYVVIELRQQQGAGAHVPFSFGIQNSKLSLGVTDDYTVTREKVAGNTDLQINTYQRIGFTINGNDWILYLNGNEDGSGTFINPIGDRSVGNITSNLQIGVRSKDSGLRDSNFFKGIISDLILHDRTLSTPEMTQLHREPYMFIESLRPHRGVLTAFNNPWWYYQQNKMRRAA